MFFKVWVINVIHGCHASKKVSQPNSNDLKNCYKLVGVQNAALRPLIDRLQSAQMNSTNL